MNKWDKVEKRKRAVTQQDIQWLDFSRCWIFLLCDYGVAFIMKLIVSWLKQWFKKDDKKEKNIRYVYSNDNCKVDEDGGPYEIDLSEISDYIKRN